MPNSETPRLTLLHLIEALKRDMPIADARKVGADLYGAPRLSAFGIFEPNEVTLSRIIADLLSPSGVHGQGPLFLNLLLRGTGIEEVGWRDHVEISCEFSTAGGRRIDILIRTPTAMVGIENKPWAGLQPKQLEDYLSDLDARSGSRRPVLILLSDFQYSAPDRTFRLPYYDGKKDQSLYGILKRSLPNTKAARTVEFISDFADWIERRFGGDVVQDPFLSPYVDAVEAHFASPQNRKAIASIIIASERLHRLTLDEIGEHVTDALRLEFPNIEHSPGQSLWEVLGKKWTQWEYRLPGWPANAYVTIEADQTNYGRVLYGLRALNAKSAEGRKWPKHVCADVGKFNPLTDVLPNGSRTDWWPWRRYVAAPNWSSKFAARLLIEADGEACKHPEIENLVADLVALTKACDSLLNPSASSPGV